MKRRYFVAMTIASVIISACVYNGKVKVPTDNTQIIQETGAATESFSLPTAGVATILSPSIQHNINKRTTSAPEPTEEVIETEQPVEEDNFHNDMSCDWDAEDAYLLAKIAMAEAEGEDTEGKALVIMVVLNRVQSDEFEDTIHDVIYEKSQFSPVSNGRFDRVEPNEDCYKALEMIQLDKWDESQGALYFESEKCADNWHSRHLEYLFTHGGHRFYK